MPLSCCMHAIVRAQRRGVTVIRMAGGRRRSRDGLARARRRVLRLRPARRRLGLEQRRAGRRRRRVAAGRHAVRPAPDGGDARRDGRRTPRAAPIATVVNTHANGDHCYGNQLVDGAEIIASTATADEMSEVPPSLLAALNAAPGEVGDLFRSFFGEFDFDGIELRLPTRTFDGRLDLDVGGRARRADRGRPGAHRGRHARRTCPTRRRLHRRHPVHRRHADRVGRAAVELDRRLRPDARHGRRHRRARPRPGHRQGRRHRRARLPRVRRSRGDRRATPPGSTPSRRRATSAALIGADEDFGRLGRVRPDRRQRRDRLPHARSRPPQPRRRRAVPPDGASWTRSAAELNRYARWRPCRDRAPHREHPSDGDADGEDEPLHRVRQVRSFAERSARRPARAARPPPAGRTSRRSTYTGTTVAGELRREAWDVEALRLGELARRTGRRAGPVRRSCDGRSRPATSTAPSGGGGDVDAERDEAAVHEQRSGRRRARSGVTTLSPARPPCERLTTTNCSSGEVRAGDGDRRHSIVVGIGAAGAARRRAARAAASLRASTLALNVPPLVEPAQLPEPEVDHRHDADDDEQVEADPLRPQQEPVHAAATVSPWLARVAAALVGWVDGAARLPHPARREDRVDDRDQRLGARAGRAATPTPIRRRRRTRTRSACRRRSGFPEVAVFGLTPVGGQRAARARRRRAAAAAPRSRSVSSWSACSTTTCAARSPRSTSTRAAGRSSTRAIAWYRGEPFELVQLLYPDRNGFMPYEAGYDQRMRFAQPVLGRDSTPVSAIRAAAPFSRSAEAEARRPRSTQRSHSSGG